MSQRYLLLTSIAVLGLVLGGCSSKPTQPATEAPTPGAQSAPPSAPEVASQTVPQPTNAVVGEVQEVDPKGAYLIVKTSDGKLHRVETPADANLRKLKHGLGEVGDSIAEGTKSTMAEVKKGTLVAVRYTEKDGKLVAHEIQNASKTVVKKSEVVIDRVEEGGSKIIVKTKNGTEEAYHVGKNATIAAGDKISDIGKATGAKFAAGTKATIHFTEEQGQKVAHFVNH